jgi:hypothetical protein
LLALNIKLLYIFYAIESICNILRLFVYILKIQIILIVNYQYWHPNKIL